MTASGRSRSMAANAGSNSPTPRTSTGISTMPVAGAAIFISASVATFEALSGLMRKATRLTLGTASRSISIRLGPRSGLSTSAWAGETRDQARAHRIANTDHDDGNGGRGLLGSLRRRRAEGRDHVDRAANKLRHDLR